MVMLAENDLITVWERAWSGSPTQQAIALLQMTAPATSVDDLLELPIGSRDSILLDLREALFGQQLSLLVECPSCQERVELELGIPQLRMQATVATEDGLYPFHIDALQIRFRVPDSRDLLFIGQISDPDQRRTELLNRCIVSAISGANQIGPAEINERQIAALLEAMDAADPQANVEVPITCPTCEHHWNGLFDIVSFLWSELDTWAQRTLNEIHLLASAYGWTEEQILKLSPVRRQLYLGMIRQ
jgi:hypothetical protein